MATILALPRRASSKRILLGKQEMIRQGRHRGENGGDFANFLLFRSAAAHAAEPRHQGITFIFLSSDHLMKRKRRTSDSDPSSSDDADDPRLKPLGDSEYDLHFCYRYIEKNFYITKISSRERKIRKTWLA
jgi:hypothetical protein